MQSPLTITKTVQIFTDPTAIVALILLISTICYSIMTTSRNNRARKFFLSSSTLDAGILDDAQLVNSVSDSKWLLGSDDHYRQHVYDDERGSVAYNYSLFHVMLVLAVLNYMMILTK
jgi:hypothetical protein